MMGPIVPDQLDAWCRRWLGAGPAGVLFEAGHLSAVVGLRLADGREVVVKARSPADRLAACCLVQHRLWAAGFPCPRPLAGPAPLGALLATAETCVPGGAQLAPGPDSPRLFAEALARLVALAPPPGALPALDPTPAWVCWDHDQLGIWPIPDDRDADLNAQPGPDWLDDLGRRARRRLARCDLPPVVGHGDWESQNLRWRGRRLHVVHDWDSAVARPEAALAGTAAAVFTATGAPLTDATLTESAAFLDAYAVARGRAWDAEERQVAWVAGLWVRAFNAKKAVATGDARAILDRLAAEAGERLRLAGA